MSKLPCLTFKKDTGDARESLPIYVAGYLTTDNRIPVFLLPLRLIYFINLSNQGAKCLS